MYSTSNHAESPIGRANFYAVSFYIMGSEDIKRESHATITNKNLWSGQSPVAGGLYDPHLGTTELGWRCQTCLLTKQECPGHSGHTAVNYPLQNPAFRRELIRWLRITCHKCGQFVVKKNIDYEGIPDTHRLGEFNKTVRSGASGVDKQRKCAHCGALHPTVQRDKQNHSIVWRVLPPQDKTGKPIFEQIYNNEIYDILNRIPNDNVLQMGKKLDSHPKKLILTCMGIPSTVIRPEIRKIGGNRSTMSDITGALRNIMDYNTSIPSVLPKESKDFDQDNHSKAVLIDQTIYEMIMGSGGSNAAFKLQTNTNRASNSIANRLSKKHGRLRSNLMGKRTTKMMRSVITGDKALRPDQVGVPKLIAKSLYIPETVRPWNHRRMMMYFTNGTKKYPGCNKIKRADTGREHYVNLLPKDYVLQDGDVIYRQVVDNDSIGFNREPALKYCSIAVMRVKVINGLTLRLNSAVCALFNADFDGDEMNGLLIKNPETIAETKFTSSINEWFVEYQNSKPVLGLYYDSVIGAFEMTHTKVDKIHKFHAMRMCNRTSTVHPLVFDKPHYHARELISMFLPDINYRKRAGYYEAAYDPYIKYRDDEINVEIKRGNLVQGILDKATIGQKVEGSIFHVIYTEKGATAAIDCIYNLQQLINGYIYHTGVTFGLLDIYLPPETKARIRQQTDNVIRDSETESERLENGELVPPIEMTLEEFYESKQMNVLEHGDEFIQPIIENIDYENNWFYKLVHSGSKGDRKNMLAIYSAIGSIGIKGKRIRPALNGRTTINFQRGSTDPISRGYNPNSFSEGINVISFPFSALEARHELIEVAMSTALAGTMNRNAVKNLEANVVSNTRSTIKKNRLVQLIYGENGIDPRRVEKTKFPTITLSDTDFDTQFRCTVAMVDSKFRNKEVEKLLDTQFQSLKNDRDTFRNVMLKYESNTRRIFLLTDVLRMPVNPERIIINVVQAMDGELKKGVLNPANAIEKVAKYCNDIGYVYMNEIQRKAGAQIPYHIQNAVTFLQILLRSYLCPAILLKAGVNDYMLDLILDRINLKIRSSFIDYGTSVGVIAAESISEPITQFLLDAKHRSGLRKEKINTIERVDEILSAKKIELTVNMMTLIPRDEYKYDMHKVQEIANHIEMLPLRRFIKSTKVFVEEYGKPVHPAFRHEADIIRKWRSYKYGDPQPTDLINWCIRFVFDKQELILKSMKLKTIYFKLKDKFPYLYVVHTPQNSEQIIMRIYIKNAAFKRGVDINLASIEDKVREIKNCIIRGVSGIRGAEVIKNGLAHTTIMPNGSTEAKKMYYIETDGTNLSEILENPYLNQYECNTNSIAEIEKVYGIEAARNKILYELQTVINDQAIYEHSSIYADEMTYTGRVTNIQRSGLGKREIDNVLLRASFGGPIQVLQYAAINSQTDHLHGMSASMVMGSLPKFGSVYNDVVIDEQMLLELEPNIDEGIKDL